MQALLAGGADVIVRCGPRKRSVVLIAAAKGDVNILRAVNELGADVDAADTDQSTALHIAMEDNKFEAIDVLVRVGANVKRGCCAAAFLLPCTSVSKP